MNNKKILFFDIDGTLLTPHPFKVPESTKLALTKAHENGHFLFITKKQIIRPEMESLIQD